MRYNLFQLFIGGCTTQGSLDNDPDSVPAKTLSGFGYRRHIFWDTEIFILPFFIFTQPAIARSLLNYRYDTLPGARRKAAHAGYKGAMFAWESAATGDEMTPKWSMSSANVHSLQSKDIADRAIRGLFRASSGSSGDATVGVQAAIAAGMRSIGIGPITRVGAADIVLPNLIGVHLVDLQTQLKLAPKNFSQPIETPIL